MRALAKRWLLASGHYGRRLERHPFPGVAVLCYHGVREAWSGGPLAGLHVRSDELEAHCRLLSRHCHPISLARLRSAFAGGEPLPARPVLLTFDDCYRSLFHVALPILERHRMPAAIFACSDPIARRELFWFDALARTRGAAAVEEAKRLDWAQWQALVEALPRAAAAGDPDEPLTVAELRLLASRPGIEIGGHTASHPILARASRERQRAEVSRNLEQLAAWLGRPVAAFAYPNGRPRVDYTGETVDLLAELGIEIAFTTRQGFATAGEPRRELPRFFMLSGVTAAELAHRLCYSWRR